jgi:single-stranded DNA-binding protein
VNSFSVRAVGNLARNPEVLAKGNLAYVRFCLVGSDYAEPDDMDEHARAVVTSIWFIAFDKIADDLVKNARKGDQLILEARVRAACRTGRDGTYQCENVFIVTGFRYGAKKGGPGAVGVAVSCRTPSSPTQPAEEAVAMTG